ncbi:phage tail spike protein [Lactobacillus acetotolerans]|uniref:phage tail spike protein n=1 Tax=Lactobacillus acetotolerans TaxID=1600 RepID=UPI002FD89D43
MQLYVLDRSKNVLATTASFYNDKHHQKLTAGASQFQFDISKSDPAAKHMISGNYINMLDDQGRPWSFTILNYDEYQTYKTVFCNDVGIELYNKATDIWYYTDPHPFSFYFDLITENTNWELGINQLDGLSRSLSFQGRNTGLGRLLDVLTEFDHAECIFNITMRGSVPVKYVIDVYKQIGTVQSNIQIVYNEELNDIHKKETRADFVTALAGVGSVIENTDENADSNAPQQYVDFSDLAYDDGDFYTTKGDKFLRARTANKQFNPGDQGFVEAFYEYDTSSNTELFNRTLTQIQTRSQPQFTYEADVKVIDPRLQIGDTVTMIDHDYNPALYLSARVATLDKSYTDITQGSITFTNYQVLTSDIDAQIAALRNKVNGIKNGKTTYVWIRYADDDQGTNMSASPYGKEYVAIVPKVNQPIPSDDPADYVGQWALIQGANGKNGDNAYLHTAYANSVDGKTDFTIDQDQAYNRDYLGTYSDATSAQSTDPTKYVWQLIRGRQGEPGQPGSKDVPVVTVNSVAPTNPKDGDLWYQTTTDADGTRITGFTVYNNGKWESSKIDQSVLVVTKLVSVEIDSATINSPDITVPFDYFDEELNEYKGSMEFKDGIMRHVSTTVANGAMLRTLIKPTGYTLDAYQSEQDFKNENPYIHTEVYADNISVSNKNSEKSGALSSEGISGSINDGSDSSIGIGLTWADVQKYLSEESQIGSKRTFNWFDMMESVQSHPNLVQNSTFINGQTNWDGFSPQNYMTNVNVDGNFAVCITSAGGSNFIGQDISHFPDPGNKICIGYVANVTKNDGGLNAGMLVTFQGANHSVTANITDTTTGWHYWEFNPIVVPNGTTGIRISFFNNEHNGNQIYFVKPMINIGDHVWPYQPT